MKTTDIFDIYTRASTPLEDISAAFQSALDALGEQYCAAFRDASQSRQPFILTVPSSPAPILSAYESGVLREAQQRYALAEKTFSACERLFTDASGKGGSASARREPIPYPYLYREAHDNHVFFPEYANFNKNASEYRESRRAYPNNKLVYREYSRADLRKATDFFPQSVISPYESYGGERSVYFYPRFGKSLHGVKNLRGIKNLIAASDFPAAETSGHFAALHGAYNLTDIIGGFPENLKEPDVEYPVYRFNYRGASSYSAAADIISAARYSGKKPKTNVTNAPAFVTALTTAPLADFRNNGGAVNNAAHRLETLNGIINLASEHFSFALPNVPKSSASVYGIESLSHNGRFLGFANIKAPLIYGSRASVPKTSTLFTSAVKADFYSRTKAPTAHKAAAYGSGNIPLTPSAIAAPETHEISLFSLLTSLLPSKRASAISGKKLFNDVLHRDIAKQRFRFLSDDAAVNFSFYPVSDVPRSEEWQITKFFKSADFPMENYIPGALTGIISPRFFDNHSRNELWKSFGDLYTLIGANGSQSKFAAPFIKAREIPSDATIIKTPYGAFESFRSVNKKALYQELYRSDYSGKTALRILAGSQSAHSGSDVLSYQRLLPLSSGKAAGGTYYYGAAVSLPTKVNNYRADAALLRYENPTRRYFQTFSENPESAVRAPDVTGSAVSEQDIEYMLDIAQRDIINRFTTAKISVNLGGVTNTVTRDADLDGMINYLAEEVRGAMRECAEGVHV